MKKFLEKESKLTKDQLLAVSYTHLDVYKRQAQWCGPKGNSACRKVNYKKQENYPGWQYHHDAARPKYLFGYEQELAAKSQGNVHSDGAGKKIFKERYYGVLPE